MKNNINNEYGHCFYCMCEDKNCSMIYNLYVEKEYRRQGHAKEFIRQAMEEIRKLDYKGAIKIIVEPEESSITAEDLENFYIKMGLKITQRF